MSRNSEWDSELRGVRRRGYYGIEGVYIIFAENRDGVVLTGQASERVVLRIAGHARNQWPNSAETSGRAETKQVVYTFRNTH